MNFIIQPVGFITAHHGWLRIGIGEKMAKIIYLDEFIDSEEINLKLCEPVKEWFHWKFPDFTLLSILKKEKLIIKEKIVKKIKLL